MTLAESLRLARRAAPMAALTLMSMALPAQGRRGGEAVTGPMINASVDPLFRPFRFRSIGPASMGGRIDDIAVSESDPNTIYIGYAVGGVFKSENNGTTFSPVFTEYSVASIGDIAIHPTNPNIVYIGTGEPNNRQTSSFGDGIYKTTDGGKTFTNMGLKEVQSIARIVIDPRNPEVVYVASPGHLFGPNPDRGVYKTTDGGKTWTKIKYIDENTGFTDITMDPSNSNVLFASSYQRRRSGCCFNGGGAGSALWRTDDGGKSWNKVNGAGMPPGTYGRIAVEISRSNANIVYAQIEAGESGTPIAARAGGAASMEGAPDAAGPGGPGGGRGAQYDACNNGGPGGGFGRGGFGGGRGGDAAAAPAAPQVPPALDPAKGGVFRSDDRGRTWKLQSNCNSRPMYFSQLRVDPQNPNTIYVAGLPVAKSMDGGKTFATLDDAGGNGAPAHVDQHAIWIDPKNPKHLMIGNDGGLDISWDQGKSWDFVNTMATGLAYWVTADMQHPYNVYTGLQDNGSWGGPSQTRSRNGILNTDWFGIGGGDGFQTAVDPNDPNIVFTESQDGSTSRYNLKTGEQRSIRPSAGGGGRGGAGGACGDASAQGGGGGGRALAAAADATAAGAAGAAGAAAAGGRGGRGGRGAGAAGAAGAPGAPAGAPGAPAGPPGGFGGGRGGANVLNAAANDQYRFNWNTPYMLSPHNSSIVYLGGNRLFKSYNHGDTWVASADLTKNIDRCKVTMMGVAGDYNQLSKNDGVVSYSTIISVNESPVMPGIVWAGTDDGLLQVSRDGGATFTEVGKNIPGLPANHEYWFSRIETSHFDAGTAYISVDGHRSDDLKPYVFVTTDYGRSFKSISNNLPVGNVQVVRQDLKNKDLLFVGTEFGLYASTNAGGEWKKFMNNLPTVRVDDILVHSRESDLIVATHGRSLWIADDISALQQLTPAVTAADATLFDIRTTVAYQNDQTLGSYLGGQKNWVGENAPRGAAISYYLKSDATGDVKITIADATGRVIRTIDGTKTAGLNRVEWNLQPDALGGAGGRGGFGGGGGGGRGGAGANTAGTYVVKLLVGGREYTKNLTVLEDRWKTGR